MNIDIDDIYAHTAGGDLLYFDALFLRNEANQATRYAGEWQQSIDITPDRIC